MRAQYLQLDQLRGRKRDPVDTGSEVHEDGSVTLRRSDHAESVSIMTDSVIDQKSSPRSGGGLRLERARGQDTVAGRRRRHVSSVGCPASKCDQSRG